MLKLKTAMTRQKAAFSRLRTETDGNVSLMSAVSLSALLLGVTVTIDLRSTFTFKADMQEALDTAVLAAASNANDDFSAIGQSTYALNISEGPLAGTIVNFEKQNTNDLDKMVGTASGSLPLLFSGVFKQSSMDITVRSAVQVPTSVLPCNQTDTSGLTDSASKKINPPECERLVPTKIANAINANSDVTVE